MNQLDTALAYAARGWPVFPCKRDKAPMTEHGFEDATILPDTIAAWWRRWPKANIGVATGAAGLIVVDIDVKKGQPGTASWQALVDQLGIEIVDTAVVRTPTGGRHYYYHANGHRVESSAGTVAPGIDVRGDTGYVCAPGSETADGVYEWLTDCEPAALPAALAERLTALEKAPKEPVPDGAIPQGQRNATLARLAGAMRRPGMTEQAMVAALLVENKRCTPPLPEREVRAIAASIGRYPASDTGDFGNRELPNGEPLFHEAAHAAVLAEAWRGRYRWAAHEGTWRRWSGRVWGVVGEPQVVAAAQSELRRHYGLALAATQSKADDKRLLALHVETCRYQSVLAGLAFLKGRDDFYTEFGAWDADPYTLNCADGLLDLRTQKMGPHDPAALCTKLMRWTYGDEHTTGAWQSHLERCLPSVDVRRQVQRDLGRALVGADLEESLPIWFGTGANGKSTTEHAIQQGADGYGKKAVRNLLVASKFERHPTEIADLAGSRIVFSEEVEDGKQLAEALVKDLTGGATQKARFMRCDNFEFEQTFSIFLLVNHRPVITGTDKGIWRRIRLVPWTVSIPLAEQRPQDEVVAELVADGSWMLRWMVAGFADWQADHHWVADEVQVATAAYRAEQDRLAGFIADACEERLHATAEIADLYAAYESWGRATDELTLGKIAFGKALRERGFGQVKGTAGKRAWTGIRLQTLNENAEEVATSGKNSGLFAQDDFYRDKPEKLPPLATRGDPGCEI